MSADVNHHFSAFRGSAPHPTPFRPLRPRLRPQLNRVICTPDHCTPCRGSTPRKFSALNTYGRCAAFCTFTPKVEASGWIIWSAVWLTSPISVQSLWMPNLYQFAIAPLTRIKPWKTFSDHGEILSFWSYKPILLWRLALKELFPSWVQVTSTYTSFLFFSHFIEKGCLTLNRARFHSAGAR